MKTRILLVDDHQIFLDGLRNLLKAEASFVTVGEARDGLTAVRLARELAPQVVLMDITMQGLNGIEATRTISAENPDIKVIILSMHSDRRYVVHALKAGARGYLRKDSAYEDLVKGIHAVMGGGICLGRDINDGLVKDYIALVQGHESSVYSVLSVREREVLQLLAEGGSTKEIAARLHVSVKTIETHRKQMMAKLDLHSVAELTKYAIREGLTELE